MTLYCNVCHDINLTSIDSQPFLRPLRRHICLTPCNCCPVTSKNLDCQGSQALHNSLMARHVTRVDSDYHCPLRLLRKQGGLLESWFSFVSIGIFKYFSPYCPSLAFCTRSSRTPATMLRLPEHNHLHLLWLGMFCLFQANQTPLRDAFPITNPNSVQDTCPVLFLLCRLHLHLLRGARLNFR